MIEVSEIAWINKVITAGWRLSEGDDRHEFLFSKRRISHVPRNLRQESPAQLKKSFNQLFRDERFTQWWDQTCAGKEDKFLRLVFPQSSFLPSFFTSAWDIPWELLVERLELKRFHATVSIVRTLAIEAPVSPSDFDEPMRILILQGDDGRTINRPLNLDAEARRVEQAWESLDMGARHCIDKPHVVKATQADLPKVLHDYNPHLIWFSGHGRVRPDSSLLFADGQWVTARNLAALIKSASQPPFSARPPIYAVFWACDTGRPEETSDSIPLSPALFEELTKVGVLSMLVMQSPIRDASALSMAHGILGFLAAGFPLERALARVRARLIDDLPNGGYELDWATPVVWSAAGPVERLTWNSPSQPLAQFQLLGREALRWRLKKPSELDGPPSPDELSRARTWASNSKLWIQGRYGDAEIQYRWVRALQAIQVETNRLVIAVDLRSEEPDVALREWAENLRNRILPGDFPDSVNKILDQIRVTPNSGWKSLCRLEGIYLAIAQAPVYPTPDWFWQPLLSAENSLPVAVLSDQEVAKEIESDWSLDSVASDMNEQSIKAAVSEAPRLAQALAVLNMPLMSYLIRLSAEAHEGAKSLVEWPARQTIMVDTSAGPIMTASARQQILNNQDSALRKRAHHDCARMLDQPQVRLTTQVREELLEHLLGAELEQPALGQATELCFLYKEQDRPSAVLHLLKRIGPLWQILPQAARLIAAWAYLQLGKLAEAALFLRVASPSSPLDVAWKHGLQAEIYKSEGTLFSKENALEEIDSAIEACRTAEPDSQNPEDLIQRRLRAYRQDRARILQFLFYKKEEAAAEYEQLIREWSNEPEAVIDLAVVKRNYAECLRSLALATGPEDPRHQLAQDILREAEQLVEDRPYLPILCEILYEKAKAAEAASKLSESHQLLLDCQKAALQSQHYMVWAIAANRLFWKYGQFSIQGWKQIEENLEGFPRHGWAVRTLIEGRLRAARKLEALQDFEGAFTQLDGARRALERNPSFNMGGDKLRIAETMAGLDTVGQRLHRNGFWSAFKSDYDWANEWLESRAANTAEAIWLEVQ